MNICKQCHKQFKVRVKIDGKLRNLRNRTKCLDCLPFGSSFYTPKMTTEQRKAKSTARFLAYYKQQREKLGIDPKTHLCYQRKLQIVNLLGGSCQICNYKKCFRNIVFHHIDPSSKLFSLNARRLGYLLKPILEELYKCIMVCHNCHGEIHDELIEAKDLDILHEELKIRISKITQENWKDLRFRI